MTIRAADQLGRNAAARQALSELAFSPIDLIGVAGSDANPGPVGVGDTADRGATRHE
jgi:hypothetical protein